MFLACCEEGCGMHVRLHLAAGGSGGGLQHRRSARTGAGVTRVDPHQCTGPRASWPPAASRGCGQFSGTGWLRIGAHQAGQESRRAAGRAVGKARAAGDVRSPQRDRSAAAPPRAALVSLTISTATEAHNKQESPTLHEDHLQPLGQGATAHPLNQQQQELTRHRAGQGQG